MTAIDRILDVLPPPFSVAGDAVVTRLLDAFAIELDVQSEDLDLLRRTHWVEFAFRFRDVERLAELLGVDPLPGETLRSFRVRLLALAKARLDGAVGLDDIKGFVYAYVDGAERALQSTFVPGLNRFDEQGASEEHENHPAYRPLALLENPLRLRRSASLAALHGRVPYLHRWQERNAGLTDTVATFAVTGLSGGRTAVPLLVNLTTGDLVGYAGVLRVGQRLTLDRAGGEDERDALVRLNGVDVTERAFSVSGFVPGVPFTPSELDERPLLPQLVRGENRWIFLSVGLFDVRGLDRIFYAIADEQLYEGVYDGTFFDHSVFPGGPVATLEMAWTEVEPAAFEVHWPRTVVIEAPEVAGALGGPVHERLAEGIRATLREIRAAGVRADLCLDSFRETQAQVVRVTLPWIVVEPERGPTGDGAKVALGARFGESALDGSRFG